MRVLLALLVLAASWLTGLAQARAACSPAPLSGCRPAGRNTLDVRSGSDPADRRLRWQWSAGQPTFPAGFGNPTLDATQNACLYDDGGLVLEASVAAGGSCGAHACWSVKTGKGFVYKDQSAASSGVRTLALEASASPAARIKLKSNGATIPDPGLPLSGSVTMQLTNTTSGVCFESTFAGEEILASDDGRFRAKARRDGASPAAPLPSTGCSAPIGGYSLGANHDALEHDALTRTFGVYLPSSYVIGGSTPVPLVLIVHGGFGSGDQVFTSSRMAELADDEGVVVVSPDGVAGPSGIRTWNAGGCCGYAESEGIDDVGFVAALLDRLEQSLCLDRERFYAMGMSNGAMLSYRLACDLSQRIAAVGSVAGSDTSTVCVPTRPVPLMEVHGTADMNVPWEGGQGCGPSGASYRSVADSIGGWTARNACAGSPISYLDEGDGHCARQGECASGADVVLCAIDGGGHSWPGGVPPAGSGFPDCPFGPQSTTFNATLDLYRFFELHTLTR